MPRKRWVVFLAAAAILAAGSAPADALLSIGGGVNQGCISMRIVYAICFTPSIPPVPYPCAHLSFWQPKWIVSTTPAFSGGVQNQGRPHYHLHNAVVRPVNQLFAFNDPCTGCTVPTLAALVPAFYESHADPAWRTAQSPFMTPEITALRIGVWGGAYPRVGYVTHPTPVVASALAAVRAFNIARQPVDLWPVQGLIRPTIPLVPGAQGVGPFPCMCRHLTPVPPFCFRAGFDMGSLMTSPQSPTGVYEWVIWKRRRCTLPLPLNWCAELLSGLPKLNFCP